MNLSDKFSSIYTESREITIDQCTNTSKLRLTELCNILQAVAGKHSALGGMSYFDMQQNNQAWVLSSMRVEIADLPQWHQNVDIITWIETLNGIRSIRDFEITLNNKKIIGVNSLWVVLNTERRRPENIALPHEHLTKYPDKKPTKESFTRIDLNKEATFIKKHQVVFSDLDIVNHVNNVKYIEWCLDCLPLELLENKKISAFTTNYLKELNFNDVVEIYFCDLGKDFYFYIKSDSKVCFAMNLELS